LRMPFLIFTGTTSPRALHFNLRSAASSVELLGQWRLLKRVQVPVFLYFAFCAAGEVVGLIRFLFHRSDRPVMELLGPILSFAMIYCWTRWAIWISRKSEGQVINTLTHSMTSENSTKIVGDVISEAQ